MTFDHRPRQLYKEAEKTKITKKAKLDTRQSGALRRFADGKGGDERETELVVHVMLCNYSFQLRWLLPRPCLAASPTSECIAMGLKLAGYHRRLSDQEKNKRRENSFSGTIVIDWMM